jgi:sec-independent protein translocase protein TatC
MTILEHLAELRGRLIQVACFFFIGFLGAFFFINPTLVHYLKAQIPFSLTLYTLRITEGLELSFELAALLSTMFIFPIILWNIWAYIKPGLYPEEQQLGKKYFPYILFLFIIGIVFGYFVVFPVTVEAMLHFSINLGLTPLITLKDYVLLLVKLVFSFGVLFQLPVLLVLLAKTGLITSLFMKKKRKYAYFIILVIAGILAPPELTSHLAMTLPLIGLYELSGILVQKMEKDS